MKRAFTLIELLVVIAIIAILAAILFPVFAQAKEAAKKTATLSNYKQTGTACAIYLADYDDVYPLAMSFNSSANCWRDGVSCSGSIYNAVPAGSSAVSGRNVDPRLSEERGYVLNSMHPYMKNTGLFEAQGKNRVNVGMTPLTPSTQQALVNAHFNGMLHAWSATAVADPSKLPVFWQGYFRDNLVGASFSSPVLSCGGSPGCRFNSGGPAGYGYNWFVHTLAPSSISNAIYSKTSIHSASDTSAKTRNWGSLPKWAQHAVLNVNTNPFSSSDPASDGDSPYWITDCVAPGGTKGAATYYPGYFRPDSEYNYTTAQCDHGSG